MKNKILGAGFACLLSFQSWAVFPKIYHGIWETDGYGQVYVIDDAGFRLFDTTSTTCIYNIFSELLLSKSELDMESDNLYINYKGDRHKRKAK